MAHLAAALRKGGPVKIVAFGDSITVGVNDAGSDHAVARVRHELSVMIDHLICETGADILVLSPTIGACKVDLQDQYAAMYKDVAAEKGVAYLDK